MTKHTVASLLLTDLDREAVLTRRVLRAAPVEQFGWRPHEKSMSLGELVSHLAETPSWVEGMQPDVLDMAEVMADYRPFVARSTDELLTTHDRNFAKCRAVADSSDEFLQAEWRMVRGDVELLAQPRHLAIRDFALHHQAHHRGQLTVYLRLLGVPVPPTYGPTADSSDWTADADAGTADAAAGKA